MVNSSEKEETSSIEGKELKVKGIRCKLFVNS